MLSVLLGLGMSMHLMAYQVSQQSFDQTLVTNHVNRIVAVQWQWRDSSAAVTNQT